jgi:hypothetical protein
VLPDTEQHADFAVFSDLGSTYRLGSLIRKKGHVRCGK